MKNQIQGNDQATGNKIRGDEQKIQNGVHLTPGLKSLPATSSAGPSLAPGLFGGQETPPRLVQNPAFFHGVGSPGTPNSDDVEDQVHKAALRTVSIPPTQSVMVLANRNLYYINSKQESSSI